MTMSVENSKATLTGTAGSYREGRAASDNAHGGGPAGERVEGPIVHAPENGHLHRTRLRFGSQLASDQGNLIPENSANTHCVAVFEHPRETESAIRELQGAGFDMKKLSVVGSEHHADEHAISLIKTRDDVSHWGKEGAFWGGVFGVLFWPAFFFIPGIGPILTAGLIGSALIGTLEAAAVGAALGGGTSALATALNSWGIPKDSVIGYEADLKAKRFLLIASGNAAELVGVHPIFTARGARVNVHDR
jgi:hypothetical protein